MIHDQDYHGFVYIWFDRKRKWFCVGSHMGSLEDGYTSTTGQFPKAYRKRPQDFKRRIIHWHHNTDRRSLHEAEQKYLNLIKDEELYHNQTMKRQTIRYYNMKKTASGGSGPHTEETKSKIAASRIGKPRSVETKKRISETRLARNLKWSEERKAERSRLYKGRKGPTHSEETRRRIGAASKNRMLKDQVNGRFQKAA